MADPADALPPAVWQSAIAEAQARTNQELAPPPNVLDLVAKRQTARQQKDWSKSDELRDQILDLGWQVQDTAEGPQLKPR
jgi:cysteinyl-tRNA synthetase